MKDTSDNFSNFLVSLDNFDVVVFIYNPKDFSLLYGNKKFLTTYDLKNLDDSKSINAIINDTSEEKSYIEKNGIWLQNHSILISVPQDFYNEQVMFCIQVDITDSIKIINGLKWKNELTGLSNRYKLVEDITKIITKKKKNQNLVDIDLNFFNDINYSYGHDYGNELILEISKFLYKVVLQSEVYNLQGSRFMTILDENYLDSFLVTVKNRFKDSWFIRSVEQFINISIGVVQINDFNETGEGYIYRVMEATKESKKIGGNSVRYYESKKIEKLQRNAQLEYYMRNAIKYNMDSFLVYYHPIVDAKTGKIEGFEALSRWKDSEIGFIFPDEFIGLAEYLGVINIIDMHVLKRSTQFIKRLHDLGHYVKVSVNISAKQLYDDDLVDSIKNIVTESQLEYSYVNIEITESHAIENLESSIQKINALKAVGFGVHLDDFGVGHSSLNALKDLPITTLKIDRMFVKDMHITKYNYTFVKTIIELAHSADLKVVCEGIEYQEDYDALKKLRCDYLQGYLFSKPIPEEDVYEIVSKNFGKQ